MLSSLGSGSPCLSATEDAIHEQSLLRQHGDWWLGMDVGAGAIELEFPEGRISENKFYLGARAEYVLNPKWLIGIEASGWLIEPGEIEYNTKPPPATTNGRSRVRGWRRYC